MVTCSSARHHGAEDPVSLLTLRAVPSQLLFQMAGAVSLQVGLLALRLLLALLLSVHFIGLLVFAVVLFARLPGEHLSLHGDVCAALLGDQEVFHLPGVAAVPQHEDHPVGAHHEPAGGHGGNRTYMMLL